jgi:hypothetical protein
MNVVFLSSPIHLAMFENSDSRINACSDSQSHLKRRLFLFHPKSLSAFSIFRFLKTLAPSLQLVENNPGAFSLLIVQGFDKPFV